MDRILVNTIIHDDALAFLDKAGYDVHVVREEDPQDSLDLAPTCVGIVANASLPMDGAFFELATRLRVVGRVGVGVDNVDVPEATRRAIRVCNTPLPIIEPVAEHAFALLLGLSRRILQGDASVRAGTFREGAPEPGSEIRGQTIGIIGMGNTGNRVAEIAKNGFGMNILYYDLERRPPVESRLQARRVELDELYALADVVSIHVNLNRSTRHLVSTEAFKRMKSSAFLLNLARGPIVDERALVRALTNGQIAGAGLDVFEEEPPSVDNPLFKMDNVIVHPHRGGFSQQSRVGCSRVVEDVVKVLSGEEPEFPVN